MENLRCLQSWHHFTPKADQRAAKPWTKSMGKGKGNAHFLPSVVIAVAVVGARAAKV